MEFHEHIWNRHEKCIQISTNMPGIGSLIREIHITIFQKFERIPAFKSFNSTCLSNSDPSLSESIHIKPFAKISVIRKKEKIHGPLIGMMW